nr:uncharacterized protein LOC115935800 [Gorilla gorilla gorilla]
MGRRCGNVHSRAPLSGTRAASQEELGEQLRPAHNLGRSQGLAGSTSGAWRKKTRVPGRGAGAGWGTAWSRARAGRRCSESRLVRGAGGGKRPLRVRLGEAGRRLCPPTRTLSDSAVWWSLHTDAHEIWCRDSEQGTSLGRSIPHPPALCSVRKIHLRPQVLRPTSPRNISPISNPVSGPRTVWLSEIKTSTIAMLIGQRMCCGHKTKLWRTEDSFQGSACIQ